MFLFFCNTMLIHCNSYYHVQPADDAAMPIAYPKRLTRLKGSAFLKGPVISSSESSLKLGSSVNCVSCHGLIGIAGAKPFASLAVRLVPAPIISLASGRTVFDSQAGTTPPQLGVWTGLAVGTTTSVFTNRPRLWGEIHIN